jgi:Domain of unknown function (DUF4251)
MQSSIIRNLLLSAVMITGLTSAAQTSSDQKKQDQYARLKGMIEARKYKIHANSATSMKGNTIQLTSDYFLKINSDTLTVDLPYYGRSYTTDYPSTNLSVQFKTTNFSYAADSAKKGGWNINIIPKDQAKASKIYMSISSSGYCTIQISSNQRQAISYYGIIKGYNER